MERSRSASLASIELYTSISPYSFRMDAGTVGMVTSTQLVADSNLAPYKNKPLPTFSIASRASVLHGLKANLEWTGLILPIREGEKESFLTTTSHISAGDSFRRSWTCERRTKSFWSEPDVAGLFLGNWRCGTLVLGVLCVLLFITILAFFWPLRATVTQDLSLLWRMLGNTTSCVVPLFEAEGRKMRSVATTIFFVFLSLLVEFTLPLLGRVSDGICGGEGEYTAAKLAIAYRRYVLNTSTFVSNSSAKVAIVLSILLIMVVQIRRRACQAHSQRCLVTIL